MTMTTTIDNYLGQKEDVDEHVELVRGELAEAGYDEGEDQVEGSQGGDRPGREGERGTQLWLGVPHVCHGQSEKPPCERLLDYVYSMNIVQREVCIVYYVHVTVFKLYVSYVPQRGHRPRSRPSTETQEIGEKEHRVEPRQPGEEEVRGLPCPRRRSIS